MINYLLSVIISYIYIQNCQNVNEEEQLRQETPKPIKLIYAEYGETIYINDFSNFVNKNNFMLRKLF